MNLSTDVKITAGIIIVTVLILVGSVILFSSKETSSVPKDQIAAQNGLHWHPKVHVTIKGEKKEFENNIGLGTVHQKMHTHDEDYKDGVVHMEMQGVVTKEETRLGRFFEIWGKTFNSAQIFDKKNGPEGLLTMTVNGKNNTDFQNYQMRDGDSIEIKYE